MITRAQTAQQDQHLCFSYGRVNNTAHFPRPVGQRRYPLSSLSTLPPINSQGILKRTPVDGHSPLHLPSARDNTIRGGERQKTPPGLLCRRAVAQRVRHPPRCSRLTARGSSGLPIINAYRYAHACLRDPSSRLFPCQPPSPLLPPVPRFARPRGRGRLIIEYPSWCNPRKRTALSPRFASRLALLIEHRQSRVPGTHTVSLSLIVPRPTSGNTVGVAFHAASHGKAVVHILKLTVQSLQRLASQQCRREINQQPLQPTLYIYIYI